MGRIRTQTNSSFAVGLKLCACVVVAVSGSLLHAQCTNKNYVQDGVPAALRDCQPLAGLHRLAPEAMSADDQQLILSRHNELVAAARFYGLDIDAAGWTYQQAVTPLLQKNVLLVFTNATPLSKASHFTALVPVSNEQKVQIIPAFARGLRPYRAGWETKGTYAVFNRVMNGERGERRISTQTDWLEFAVLYLTMVGRDPSVPTDTDSVKANWDLSAKRGTTPVISVKLNGAATITCADLADPGKTTIWKLDFNERGQIQKAERSERSFVRVTYISMSGPDGQILPRSTQP